MAAENEFQKPKAVSSSGITSTLKTPKPPGSAGQPGVARQMVNLHLQGRNPQRHQTSTSIHAKIGKIGAKNSVFDAANNFTSVSNPYGRNSESSGHNTQLSGRSTGNTPGTQSERAIKVKRQEVGGSFSKDFTITARPQAPTASVATTSSSFPRNLPKTSLECKSQVSVPATSHVGPCKNPSCHHCGTVIIPSPKATYPLREQPSISVNDWSIYTTKGPICSSDELDHLNDTRFEFPLPEMIFGSNRVLLVNEKTGASIEFNTLDALDSLAPTADFKVAYYKEWLSTRPKAKASDDELSEVSESHEDSIVSIDQVRAGGPKSTFSLQKTHTTPEGSDKSPDLQSVKPYDWTYSTNYKGTLKKCKFTPTFQEIPLEKLVRQDPILFFDECVLFEDELGDNGISMFSTKVRVMHSCLLLLCRFSMRVDDVAFRIRDTRVYIDLETNLVLREYKVQQASYAELLGKTGRSSDPKKLLRDSNWVSQNTPVLSKDVEIMELEED